MERLLGKKVRYARMDQNGKLHEGEGIVHSVHIGPDKRAMVRVHDGMNAEGRPNAFNIDPVAINATTAGLEKYVGHLRQIEKISVTINTEIKELAAKGNAEIEALNAAYMGEYFDV